MNVAPGAGERGGGNVSVRKRKLDAIESEPQGFEWETAKENVMPLKRGRSVSELNRALRAHDSFQGKQRLEDEAKQMEERIRSYSGDDPLCAWVEYIHWIETSMPEDTRKRVSILEKCTRALKDTPRYRNDMRYIRLWIQYVRAARNLIVRYVVRVVAHLGCIDVCGRPIWS